MEKPKVLFRADGNHDTGYGHVIRSLSIATILGEDFQCDLAVVEPDDFIQKEVSSIGYCIHLDQKSHFEELLVLIENYDIIVLDGYHFDTNYQTRIRKTGKPLVCIADLADKMYDSDVLINHAPGLNPKDFDVSENTSLCFGLDYAMVRPNFLIPIVNQKENSVFVCFGGSDKSNVTTKIVEIIQPIVDKEVVVAIGSGFQYHKELTQVADESKVKIFRSVSAEEMRELMDPCRIAIVPASTVLYETLSRGLLAISGYYVDNQINIYEGFKREALIFPYGDFSNLDSFKKYFEGIYHESMNGNTKSIINEKTIRDNYKLLFKSLLTNA